MPDTEVLQIRIAELEIEIAWQRETIETLNTTSTEHWKEIDRLSKMLDQVLNHLKSGNSGSEAGGSEPPPPHY